MNRRKSRHLPFALLALCAMLLAGCQSADSAAASGEYRGMTVAAALRAECTAREIVLTETENAHIHAEAEKNLQEYALIGEQYTLDELVEEAETDLLFQKLREVLPLDVTVSEAEIQSWYDIRLKALDNAFSDNPGAFQAQQNFYNQYGGVPPLIVPEGYIRVKRIVVDTPEEAEAVLSRLAAGDSFAALMAQTSTDPDMLPHATLGDLVGPYAATVDFSEAFKVSALALTDVGDYSGIVETAWGYEIIQLTARLESGTQALNAVHDSIDALLLNHQKNLRMQEILEGWVA